MQFFNLFLDYCSILPPFWDPFAIILVTFSILFPTLVFTSIWALLFTGFWTAWKLKIIVFGGKTIHFYKTTSSKTLNFSMSLEPHFWCIFHTSWYLFLIFFGTAFSDGFWNDISWFFDPFSSPKGAKNDSLEATLASSWLPKAATLKKNHPFSQNHVFKNKLFNEFGTSSLVYF